MEQTISSDRNIVRRRILTSEFKEGMKAGLPIGIGYFAVSFSLGIAAAAAGLTPVQGFLISITNNASAGEYAAFTLIAAGSSYLEVAAMTLIANARYLLMSCALSQRVEPEATIMERMVMAASLTDEIFGACIARGKPVRPSFTCGAISMTAPFWGLGTSFGIAMGAVLPARLVSALSVSLYGMFLAVIIPPARKDRVVCGLVAISFALSYLFSRLNILSAGTRTIVLTVALASLAAILFPHHEEAESK